MWRTASLEAVTDRVARKATSLWPVVVLWRSYEAGFDLACVFDGRSEFRQDEVDRHPERVASASPKRSAPRAEFERSKLFSNSSLQRWHRPPRSRPGSLLRSGDGHARGPHPLGSKPRYTEARKQQVEWLFLPKGFASFCRKPRIKVATYVHDVIGGSLPPAISGHGVTNRGLVFSAESPGDAAALRSDFHEQRVHPSGAATSPGATRFGLGTLWSRASGFALPDTARASARTAIIVLASTLPHKRTDLALQFMTSWDATTDFGGRIHWVGQFPAGLERPQGPRWEYHERLDEPTYRFFARAKRSCTWSMRASACRRSRPF